jgi:hypothetical protein
MTIMEEGTGSGRQMLKGDRWNREKGDVIGGEMSEWRIGVSGSGRRYGKAVNNLSWRGG